MTRASRRHRHDAQVDVQLAGDLEIIRRPGIAYRVVEVDAAATGDGDQRIGFGRVAARRRILRHLGAQRQLQRLAQLGLQRLAQLVAQGVSAQRIALNLQMPGRRLRVAVDALQPGPAYQGLAVAVGREPDLSDREGFKAPKLEVASFFSATVRLKDLEPATKYFYAVLMNGELVTPSNEMLSMSQPYSPVVSSVPIRKRRRTV